MDVDPRGGFGLRKAVATFGSEPNLLTLNQYSLETNTTGWAVVVNCAIARSLAQAYVGAASLSLTSAAAGTMAASTNVAGYRCLANAGEVYSGSCRFRAAVSARSCTLSLVFLDAAAAVLQTSTGSAVTDTTTGWTLATATATAPASTSFVIAQVTVSATAAGAEVHYVDEIIIVSNNVRSVFSLQTSTGTNQVLVASGREILYSTGSTWQPLEIAAALVDRIGPLRTTVFKDRLYVQNGTDTPVRWDGTTAVALAEGFNNSLAAPTVPPANGKMHKAKCIAAHMGCLWVANTTESGTAFKNRVRWSHPNQPEDWVDFHYIDVDTGVDGDEITALVPFQDRLLVFKRQSVFAIYGEPPDRFQIVPVTPESGTPTQEAVALTDLGVYYWSANDGVYHYDGRGAPKYVFERLRPMLETDVTSSSEDKVQLGWGNRRLWVSVPYGSAATTRSDVFVLDPSLSKTGSWVRYDLNVGPFLEWLPSSGDGFFLGAHVGGTRLLKFDQDAATDDFGSGSVHITSHYQTHWFDLDSPALDKRWRHPEIVVQRPGSQTTIRVQVFRNYDPSSVAREFTLFLETEPALAVYGTGAYGTSAWGYEGQTRLRVVRGSLLGSGRSIQLKFIGPPENVKWVVDSISLKFIPKRVR